MFILTILPTKGRVETKGKEGRKKGRKTQAEKEVEKKKRVAMKKHS